MIITDFLAILQNVKGGPSQFTARCPAHTDKQNSLSVGLGDDGRILIKCHAGCDTTRILEHMRLTHADLFSDSSKSGIAPLRQSPVKSGQFVENSTRKQENVSITAEVPAPQKRAEFAGRRVPLEDVDRALCRALQQAFWNAGSAPELASAFNAILARRMEQPLVSDALLLAAQAIGARHGQMRVQEVARQAGYSQRHLNRLFLAQIGTTVKNYTRLARFNYVLKQLQKSPYLLSALSQQAGYFDQAHFDKDFKAISGVAPQTYLECMSDFYYDGAETLATISL